MINVRNYSDSHVSKRKDLVPTLEEVKIIFIAQTGMRVSDALELKVGDIQRELELGNIPPHYL